MSFRGGLFCAHLMSAAFTWAFCCQQPSVAGDRYFIMSETLSGAESDMTPRTDPTESCVPYASGAHGASITNADEGVCNRLNIELPIAVIPRRPCGGPLPYH